MVRHRVRIRFRKQDDLRWIGHRDLMRCCERWFRRAGVALRRSEGFHPKPRMSFPSALAVGIALPAHVEFTVLTFQDESLRERAAAPLTLPALLMDPDFRNLVAG